MADLKNYILDAGVIEKKLNRLALEIIENNIDEKELILVGVANKGLVLARSIRERIAANSTIKTKLVTLQINKLKPDTVHLDPEIDYNDKVIILIDDVINGGQTLLYALKPFLNFYPKKIETLVLVQRTHTRFPIRANYKGLSLATTLQEHICVEVDGDAITGAYME